MPRSVIPAPTWAGATLWVADVPLLVVEPPAAVPPDAPAVAPAAPGVPAAAPPDVSVPVPLVGPPGPAPAFTPLAGHVPLLLRLIRGPTKAGATQPGNSA